MTVSEMASHLDKLQAKIYDAVSCGMDIGGELEAAGVGYAEASGLAQVVYDIYVAMYEKYAA